MPLPTMIRLVAVSCFLGLGSLPAMAADGKAQVIVVVGAAGSEEYAPQFREWAGRWQAAAEKGQAEFHAVGLGEESKETPDRELLRKLLADRTGESTQPLWLVLIGHGTFDGKTARFNLRGPDVSPRELGEWLNPLQRPLAVINCTSSSGPFLTELSGPDRVIIAATRSGHEYNYARFGDYLSKAITDPAADLDKDEQTSLLEAWLRASSGVREFYASEARLMTEHAILDDNGDRLGTPADWFQGIRVTKAAKAGALPDGLRASQWHLVKSPREESLPATARTRRDQIEQDLADFRRDKGNLSEEEYLAKIEPLLVELAKLYEGR